MRGWLARGIFATALGLAVGLFAVAAATPESHKGLQIYFVDVEGGQATLFVTPEGKSLLIDTGWPGNNGRDAERIAGAAKDAGIKKIDFVLITHYHDDHVGGAPQLAAKIPVGTFIDHGENRETSDASASRVFAAYQELLSSGKYKHIVAKPGEVLPITGMQVRVVTADGQVIERPLPGSAGVVHQGVPRRGADLRRGRSGCPGRIFRVEARVRETWRPMGRQARCGLRAHAWVAECNPISTTTPETVSAFDAGRCEERNSRCISVSGQ